MRGGVDRRPTANADWRAQSNPTGATMTADVDVQADVHDLGKDLEQILFGGGDSSAIAVLLIGGALAGTDRPKAAQLAQAARQLAEAGLGRADLAAAACHVRGLVERDCTKLEHAASRYVAPLAQAWATEDAGLACAEQGNHQDAAGHLRHAYAQYEHLGCTEGMARVRSRLRSLGIRLQHWTREDRPAYGWESLTDSEQRIVELVAQGLSNRQVASQVFLSPHTVAFHLRHVFWKLNVTSRVQLARLAAEHGLADA